MRLGGRVERRVEDKELFRSGQGSGRGGADVLERCCGRGGEGAESGAEAGQEGGHGGRGGGSVGGGGGGGGHAVGVLRWWAPVVGLGWVNVEPGWLGLSGSGWLSRGVSPEVL